MCYHYTNDAYRSFDPVATGTSERDEEVNMSHRRRMIFASNGPDDRTRTCGLSVPSGELYQTELHLDVLAGANYSQNVKLLTFRSKEASYTDYVFALTIDKLSSGKHSCLVLVERHTGIEPASPVWKTGMLPLH